NPPKHLDAECDSFEVTREGDAVVVRAKLGNVGAAAWAAADAQQRVPPGGVELVARDEVGKVLARVPVAARVERLGATGELALRVRARGRVTVRLEARGRCAFGEVKTFDAEKVK
ncbi:MAG: hypothetical protein J6V72_21605, partial [Kiritimatiellae bacterium]|nr:hypothetical protein [Kiritimatiellia bacterium]